MDFGQGAKVQVFMQCSDSRGIDNETTLLKDVFKHSASRIGQFAFEGIKMYDCVFYGRGCHDGRGKVFSGMRKK